MIAEAPRRPARAAALSPVRFALALVPLAAACAAPADDGPTVHRLPAWAEPRGVPEADPRSPARIAIEAVLDDFHAAASAADGPRYFGHLAEHSIFYGTDATERWTREEFRAYAEPFFAQGRGWTYEPFERHVYVTEDGCAAWFDERLRNAKYGEARSSGVLVRSGGAWRITQYNLALPVPNELAADLVERIRAL